MRHETLIANLESFRTRVTGMNFNAFNQNLEQFKKDISEIADEEIRHSSLNQLNEIGKYRIYVQDKNIGMIQRDLVPEIQKLIDAL